MYTPNPLDTSQIKIPEELCELSEKIAEKLQCEIYMYEELGHAAYEEAKDFNKRIYRFLQK